jgi:pilus assembly protein CpaE
MRGCLIVCPDQNLGDQLAPLLSDLSRCKLAHRLNAYPDPIDLPWLVQAHAPQVIFLSTESLWAALGLIRAIEASYPNIQIVALNRTCDPEAVLELMRAGVREFLSLPFSTQTLEGVLNRVERILVKRPAGVDWTEKLVAFLPSKGGVGTSTIALNTTVALARAAGGKVLLTDLNLGSGAIQFMLNLRNPFSIVDAAEQASRLDETLWRQLVSQMEGYDVLPAGKPNPEFELLGHQISDLLNFMRRSYRAVCFDLSPNLDALSMNVLRECKEIFLVCTPEITSLELGRQKFHLLRSLHLAGRVHVLMGPSLNPSPLPASQIEATLGASVAMTFIRDPKRTTKAVTAGTHVDEHSELGRQFKALAASLQPLPV